MTFAIISVVCHIRFQESRSRNAIEALKTNSTEMQSH